ncbi:probable E3 ubiquitin-protein ligase RHB1A [Rhodamnia argentea]|uniref:RING-type E3 ubiquitin transferase n=1 Tax=Rhodamnia argentea TaxID=178133 RepID=A0A8B8MZG2_9MYRT|nr:probable E3 ubiquitin-protein ligase RHB1A [Rhodamnia argentea]
MGGCCCSTRKAHLNGAPVYYYYPPSLEEHESLTSHDATAAAITSGFLVDLQLEASIPDNFRPPPLPLPYDAVLRSLPIGTDSVRESVCLDHMEPDYKAQSTALLGSPKAIEVSKSNDVDVSVADEEDVCPICLEGYNEGNPRFITNCEHHFHLSCILEWMERSDICPICDKIMEFNNSFDL